MRIHRHPILGETKKERRVTLFIDGKEIEAYEGEPIAAALTASGYRVFRKTNKIHSPRGYYCGIGQCTDCMMTVDGIPNIRTCITPVRQGMCVETQVGMGRWET